jgi:uncharacterized membrane protein
MLPVMVEKLRESAQPEHRVPVFIATVLALASYLFLPNSVQFLPFWLVPSVGALVLIPLILVNPRRLTRQTRWSRWIGIGFSLALASVNTVYIVRLLVELVHGSASGPSVLLTALSVWITNVIAFALVYWELDRGGPVARRVEGVNDRAKQDFRFPQQDNPHDVGPWSASFFDYAYFSLTNMMAFSPTDVMPLTLRGKGFMALQSLTGFVLLALVISRAVNILT